MDTKTYGFILPEDPAMSLAEYLNISSYDELGEIDLIHDRCTSFYHTEGKYFVPITNSSYTDLYHFAAENMIHPQDKEIHLALMEPSTLLQRLADPACGGMLHAQFRYKLLNGGWRWVEQVVLGGAQHGLPEGVVRVFTFDIQRQKDREAGAESATEIDHGRSATTGLLREDAFFLQADGKLRETPEGLCLLAIDIEHFKLFNDWYGRDSGDLLIAEAGALLRDVEQETGGVAGYLGQDDFCLLMPYDMAAVNDLYEKLRALIVKRGASVGFVPAIGIAPAGAGKTALDLLDQASLAATAAKSDFHSRVRVFEPSMFEHTEREYRLLSDFQPALQAGEFFFVLQPQCRLSTGKVVGAEALARWHRSDGTIVSPGVFIPVLEKHGFIIDLDKYIWEAVCAWLRRWIDQGHKPIPVSINISRNDIYAMDVVSYLDDLVVNKYHLPRSLLKMEITESAYVEDMTPVREAVRRLREKGFVVLMDDFGAGYSSLNMLHDLSVDVIKLDAKFLPVVTAGDDKGIHILESVMNMARNLALPVVVEGVETREQMEFLDSLGCSYVQGYFFYRPMLVTDVETLLGNEINIDERGFVAKANEQMQVREFLDESVYSDAMLNSILGPVAFYARSGENVDIIRFNQQFSEIVNVPDFDDRLTGIQSYIPEDDLSVFYDLMDRAAEDRLNGAADMVRFVKWDGSVVRFLMRLYFLGEEDGTQRFYGSVQDITAYTEMQNQMRLLSRYAVDTVVFLKKQQGRWRCQVVIHGLTSIMGLNREQLEQEMNDGRFYQRVDVHSQQQLRQFSNIDAQRGQGFHAPFSMKNTWGDWVKMEMKADDVHDVASGVECIVMIRKWDDE